MGEEQKRSRTWWPWAVGIGLLLLGISMFFVGRKGAMSDRPNFYVSLDGIVFALSPLVVLAATSWLAILVLLSGRRR
jgi:hypothetical protein